MRLISVSIGLMIALFIVSVEGADRELFPLPDALRPAVDFWTRVYTEVDSSAGYVHDNRNLDIVYETLNFKPHSKPRRQKEVITATIQRYRKALRVLAGGKREDLSEDEKKLVELWGVSASSETLNTAANNLRFQRGQSDRFRDGVIRSGAWEIAILDTLKNAGIPGALAVIPHIESSYNPSVRSLAGAVGLWQFTRMAGTKHLRVDHVVDERLEPLKSTMAATAKLKHNYEVLNSWPLAITAYNSGLSRVRDAVRKTGSKDISVIVREYKGKRFGFASRNFYAAFLAVVSIAKNIKSYFGLLIRNTPEEYQIAEMPAYLEARVLADSLSVGQGVLKQLYPALQYSVWNGSKYIPRGYYLKLPPNENGDDASVLLERIAATEGHANQIPDTFYIVKQGDTLSAIAQRYKISVQELVALNNLRSRHRIRAGQSLRLPQA